MTQKWVFLVAGGMLLTALGVAAQTCTERCYFASPDAPGSVKAVAIDTLNRARKSLDIAMGSFTDDQLGNAVVQASRRGVAVRVLLGQGQDIVSGGEYQKLVSAGIPVIVAKTTGLFHHKFAVIDGNLVITGSYDWTETAGEGNYENIVLIHCPVLTATKTVPELYAQEFNRLWEKLGRIKGTTPEEATSPLGVSRVIIHEVDRLGECIQLLNVSSAPVDLAGWSISDLEGSYTFPAETLILPNEPYEVCIDTYNPTHDTQKLYLGDLHDEVFLVTPEGKIVDEVVW